ncbi:hypothetical protein VTI74DRAFT_1490 [Chaetomium olivicolor]
MEEKAEQSSRIRTVLCMDKAEEPLDTWLGCQRRQGSLLRKVTSPACDVTVAETRRVTPFSPQLSSRRMVPGRAAPAVSPAPRIPELKLPHQQLTGAGNRPVGSCRTGNERRGCRGGPRPCLTHWLGAWGTERPVSSQKTLPAKLPDPGPVNPLEGKPRKREIGVRFASRPIGSGASE